MASRLADPAEPEDRLDALIATILQAIQDGENVDPADWISCHPEFAAELEAFFQDFAALDRVLEPSLVPARASGDHFGPYRLVRVIGKGGMGVVHEAVDEERGAPCALKLLLASNLHDPRSLARFRRETAVVSDLGDHPNIVPRLDAGLHEGIPFFTMPLIDGPNLRVVLRDLRKARPEPPTPHVVALPESPDDLAPLTCASTRWRAVARLGLQAARALSHAHRREVLHRDIKPSNLLLDRRGFVHLTDFGLARGPDHADLTTTGDLIGTLRYLAPERFHGWCDPRSDVYSLGLVLFEFLTLRPAFDDPDRTRLIHAILSDSPPRPRSLDRTIPRALEMIVLKAIEKEPGHRYPSADALADDLRRFHGGQPILARRVSPLRRVWSWSRRNKSKALGSVVALIALLGFVVGSVRYERMRVDKAQAERDGARIAEEESRYRALVLELQQSRAGPRFHGWSDRAWEFVKQAAALRRDAVLRDQAAATLVGLDAFRLWMRDDFGGASSLAFDREGRLLLVGGLETASARDGRARLLDAATGRVLRISEQSGPGPVAFDRNGTPLQLITQPPNGLVLWDIARQAESARFEVPTRELPRLLALSADGTRIAASAGDMVLVWERGSVQPLQRLADQATALAFSPDGRLLAIGDGAGTIRVSSAGVKEPVVLRSSRRMAIRALCFGRDPLRPPDGRLNWCVAAGDEGGRVTTWDLATTQPRVSYLGSQYQVDALAFSSDGSTLVSAGRYLVHVWDAATGRMLLAIPSIDRVPALGFAPDDLSLGVISDVERNTPQANSGVVHLWRLDDSRGIRTLRGLTGPISHVAFSSDGRHLAALAHDWRVAAWDLDSGTLRLMCEGPAGFSADNAALALSRDGRRLAVSAGREAQLWDLEAGRQVDQWPLPPGLTDALAFDPAGKLLLWRSETVSGAPPFGTDWQEHPRVVRLRELSGPNPTCPVVTITSFPRRIVRVVADPDGRYVAVGGYRHGPNETAHVVGVFAGPTYQQRWSSERVNPPIHERIVIDSSGSRLACCGHLQLSMPDCQPLPALPRTMYLSPDFGVGASHDDERLNRGFTLRGASGEPLVSFGLDIPTTPEAGVSFSRDGKLLACGMGDGSVLVCSLSEIEHRLEDVRLGWSGLPGTGRRQPAE